MDKQGLHMQRLSRVLRVMLIAGVISGILAALAVSPHPATAQNKLQIVTTVGMITDMVQIIGGDRVEVTGLMGPGVDPHLYRATANDVQTLASADLIFYGGLNLEGKMGEIFAKMGSRVETVPVGDAVPVEERLDFPGYAGFSDPHIWFDVSYWSLGAQRIADTLARVDPDGAPDFQARAKTLLEQLAALDGWIKESILTIPASQRVLITSHDAFRYYGRRYGLEVVGLQGISTDAEASAEDVRKLAELIVTRKLPSIFIETSVPQRTIEAVQAAAENAGQAVKIGGTLFSDAMGDDGTLEGTYIGMLTHNTATITHALGGKVPSLPTVIEAYQPLADQIVNG